MRINRTHDIISVSSCISNKSFKHCSMYFFTNRRVIPGTTCHLTWILFFIWYYKRSCVSIIHDIPTWYNNIFNTNEVIISLYSVLLLFIDKTVYFTQLLHLIAITFTSFLSSGSLSYQNASETSKTFSKMTIPVLSHSIYCLQHRWVLPVFHYPSILVIYHYPPFRVIFMVILLIFIIQNYPKFGL